MAIKPPTIATTAMAATGNEGLPEAAVEEVLVALGMVWMPAVVMRG